MSQANCLFILPRYHKECETILEEMVIGMSGEWFSSYPVSYCPKCEKYIYLHGENGEKGIESDDSKKVGDYIDKLMALNPANKKKIKKNYLS